MVLLMSRPQKHPKTGVYRSRKVVPSDLREVVGKRELIESLGTKDPAEARRLHAGVLARFERQLEAARAKLDGKTQSLTPREIAELAGEIYRQEAARAENEHSTVEERELGQELLMARLRVVDEEEVEVVPLRRDLDEAAALLAERGLVPDQATIRRVAEAVWRARTFVADLAIRRAQGNWKPDPYADHWPTREQRPTPPPPPAQPQTSTKLTTDALLEKFVRENPQQPKTLAKREAALRHLEAAAGHSDATRITKADVFAMKEARQAAKVSTVTVAAEIGTLRPLWSWGLANGLLPEGTNPFSGMTPKTPRGAQPKRLPFDDAEAVLMLRDARMQKGWKRWLPWLLAFTGARLEEACGADAADVRLAHSVWCLDIHARSGRHLKTAQAQRMVPLHEALIAEGFLKYAQDLPASSPLFPDLRVGSWDRRSSVATKHLGRWLRGLGITNPQKVAGHSWRHRMKDQLRFARVPAEAADAILGHDNPTNAGSGYGEGWRGRPDELVKELAKVMSPLG